MRSRRALLVAALVALAAIAAVLVVLAHPTSALSPGPLNPGIDGAAGIGMTFDLGQSLSVSGPWIIRNPSDHPLTLDRVHALGIVHGSPQVLGAYLLPLRPGRSPVYGRIAWSGFRVPATGRSLPGAIIGPHEKLQFVLGLRATKRGRHTLRAVDILYHGGSTHYRVRAVYSMAICTTTKDCKDPLWTGN